MLTDLLLLLRVKPYNRTTFILTMGVTSVYIGYKFREISNLPSREFLIEEAKKRDGGSGVVFF